MLHFLRNKKDCEIYRLLYYIFDFCRDTVSLVVTFLIVLVMAYGKDISPEYHLNKALTDHFIRYL